MKSPATLDPVDCNGNGPEYLTNFEGNSFGNPETQEWHIPYKNYILKKVELWKGSRDRVVSGFEVTFGPDNDSIMGWPEVTQFFGNKDLNEDNESVTFVDGSQINEIKDIEFCFDFINNPTAAGGDFEGFRFTLFNNQQIELQTNNPTCAQWQMQELNGKRLIGFRVVETDYPGFPGTQDIVARNIRQIQPIVGCAPCDVSMI